MVLSTRGLIDAGILALWALSLLVWGNWRERKGADAARSLPRYDAARVVAPGRERGTPAPSNVRILRPQPDAPGRPDIYA